MTKVTLFIPGLFGPDYDFVSDYIPALPALTTLLAKANRQQGSAESVYRTLYALAGFTAAPEKDIPVAAITHYLDADEHSNAIWMRADPAHLHADRDGAVMVDAARFSLNRHDALALAGEVRESFTLLGWQLEVPVSERWYLRLHTRPKVQTVEPDKVIGNDVFKHLPAGETARDWHRLINELQMVLHNSDVNQLREQRGELAVNSLWLWGSGREPDCISSRWQAMYSSDLFVQGLAKLSATPCYETPVSMDNIELNAVSAGNILIYLDKLQNKVQYQDVQGWHDLLQEYEQNWFLPILEYIQQKQVTELNIHCGTAIYTLTKKHLLFFWRRTPPFSAYINSAYINPVTA